MSRREVGCRLSMTYGLMNSFMSDVLFCRQYKFAKKNTKLECFMLQKVLEKRLHICVNHELALQTRVDVNESP